MPKMETVQISKLDLDLSNYRTVRQANEIAAIEAMISTSPDRFWALTESLLRDGYLPTENIIVLRTGKASALTVKEGNRRIAALKLILGLQPIDKLNIPDNISDQISSVSKAWLQDNASAPCTIYDAKDADKVDRIVTLTHGKGEKAGRDQWNAVARARHNRDVNKVSEPALDLLEKYLAEAKNVTNRQKALWAGAFPLSVLDEAMKRLAPRIGISSAPALATGYRTSKFRDAIESIIHDIGINELGFEGIRDKTSDFAAPYGVPAPQVTPGKKGKPTKASPTQPTPQPPASPGTHPKKALKAVATGDPRAVKRLVKDFLPMGKGREKVVALRDEAGNLDLRVTPLAFCFVLRSMFEISAKVYGKEHASKGGPSTTKPNGQEKFLVEVLREVTGHITKNQTDKEKVKLLHGALTELAKKDGLLSVTSMNQLIHNPRFSIAPADIAILFGNILPLLEAMNS